MIDFIPSTSIFRKVPHQSGVYQIDLDVILNNHNNTVRFDLSGYGSRFFSFGIDSGSYYASGNQKNYFESNVSNIERKYSFVLADNTFDVYDFSSNPFCLNIGKPTGILERIYVTSSSGTDGRFSLELKGNSPVWSTSGNIYMPIDSYQNTSFSVINSSNTPFNILSGGGTLPNYVSGVNVFPISLGQFQSGSIPISGRLSSLQDSASSYVLYSDHNVYYSDLNVFATYYSGSGFVMSLPTYPIIPMFGNFDMLLSIQNTGTNILSFTPVLGQKVSGSPVGAYQSFSVNSDPLTVYPNRTVVFSVSYTGISLGVNVANLLLSGLPYSVNISGGTY